MIKCMGRPPVSPVGSRDYPGPHLAMDPGQTYQLLHRWHDGDATALHTLIEQELPWIRERVEAQLGPRLREAGETEDYVQEAVVKALRYTPRFIMSDREQFRGLLIRITENLLRDQLDRLGAKKRDVAKERPLPGDSLLVLDPLARSVTRPSQAADRNEHRAWARLAVEMLDPEDRSIVRLRQWEERSFAEVGAELGISADAAKTRFYRILPRLARMVTMLRDGKLAELLEGEA